MLLFAQSSLPPPSVIRETAEEVVSRPHFDLDVVPRRDATPLLLELLRWMLKPFEWIYDYTEGLPEAVRWMVVIALLLVVIALIAHIVYTFVSAIRGPVARRIRPYAAAVKQVDPDELEREAESCGTAGDYIAAIRLLLRAGLRRIELAEKKSFRPGITNRELLRRYRSSPLFESLERLVTTFELTWYGTEPCELADYQSCVAEHARIRDYVSQSRTTVAA